jgi:hypothetical protein
MADLPVWQGTVQDEFGNAQGSTQITVRRESDNALVSLFSDRAGASGISNPFTTGPDGKVVFYTADEVIEITAVSGAGTDVFVDVETKRFGTAALSDIQTGVEDVTGLRAMIVGAFGNGNFITSTEVDLNNYNTPGRYITPATGLTNLPSGFIQTRYYIEVGGSDTFHNYQKIFAISILTPGLYSAERNYAGGVGWQAWVDNLNSANAADITAKSWVTISPAGAILGSFNVSSLTDVGTGDSTIIFATAFADTNYAYSLGGLGVGLAPGAQVSSGASVRVSAKLAGSCRVLRQSLSDGVLADVEVSAIFFGDQ